MALNEVMMRKAKKGRAGVRVGSNTKKIQVNGSSEVENNETKAFSSGVLDEDENKLEQTDQPIVRDNETFSTGRFHDLGLAETFADHLHGRMGFESPTHIQRRAIPVVLSGRDVLVNSETGTGKTLIYLVPIINALQGARKRVNRLDGTYAIVLVPTRELCVQVFLVAEKLVHRFIWLVPGCLMGGENRNKEKARLRKGITLLISTPGRLLDHLKNTNSFKIDPLKWLVFDEADRLLDLGFEKDIQSIMTLLNTKRGELKQSKESERQNILLSATLDDRVNKLAAVSLSNPVTIGLSNAKALRIMDSKLASQVNILEEDINSQSEVEEVDEVHENAGTRFANSNTFADYNIPSQLIQAYYKVPCKLRLAAILALLRQHFSIQLSCKLVIFVSTCDAVDFHFQLMNEYRTPGTQEPFIDSKSFKLHGNMPQKIRTETFLEFGKASSAYLICTDVASRGLDFKGVTCIIQYDPPGDPAEYVHRVGRTARIGERGEAIIFLQPCEMDYLAELKKHKVTLKELSLSKLMDSLPSDGRRTGKKRNLEEDWTAIDVHPAVSLMNLTLETLVAKSKSGNLNLMAVKAFNSYVRAYAAHKAELKPIFQVHKLHLGHVAKSFGLKSAPQVLGRMGFKAAKKAGKLDKDDFREKKKDVCTPRSWRNSSDILVQVLTFDGVPHPMSIHSPSVSDIRESILLDGVRRWDGSVDQLKPWEVTRSGNGTHISCRIFSTGC